MFEFLRFAAVGIMGFIADTSSFYILLNVFDFVVFDARSMAFTIAVLVTWLGNSLITFKNANKEKTSIQVLKYILVALTAGAVNLFIFNSLILWGIQTEISFVLGVLIGMIINYLGVKFGVFKSTQ
ncbi:GtrA family protein [Pseudoalteromonas sp. C2R02]|uniref:GtrA family protein n=1 Tax=Pseudoalteromonas sp. C2R02 TaxID=2841565 RepID=UPI001C095CC5|nr:GtrA family protein [Pseudoalteromonas sp. C2R02]MBU2972461.1 GtrA family protein [Pseudoalteromonas sp. C2R02]